MFTQNKNGEAHELLRIFQVHIRNECLSLFSLCE